jgi:LPXTG-motif cell wall-anchored protein
VAAAATVIALIAAFASVGQANAAEKGVGTTETATSLVDVALGSVSNPLLHLRILGDDAKATIDPKVGTTSAFSQLFALKLTSSLLPAALKDLTVPSPAFESRSPGGTSNFTGPVINLANAVPVLGGAVASGSVAPVNLTSSAGTGLAKSGLSADLANIGLLGGLLNVQSVKSTMGSLAGIDTADGSRLLDVSAISVLNLGALLKGLGIDITNLPVTAVSSILSTLNIPVAGLPTGQTLGGLTSTLNNTINGLKAQILSGSSTFGQLPVVGGLIPTLNGLGLPVAGGAVAIPDVTNLNTVLTQVQTLLTGLLGTAMNAINDLSLLTLNGLKVGTTTKAVSSTKDSKADVIGTLGGVKIGGLDVLNGVDLSSALATVTNLVNSIQGTLSGVLGAISPDLANLLSIKFFDKAANNGVTSSGGYTRSLAGISGLAVGITPPANLAGVIGALNAVPGIGDLFAANSTAGLPVLGGLMGTLGTNLPSVGNVVGALAGGATIKVASVTTGSNFAAPGSTAAAAAPVSQLPRTGANTTVFLLIGMLMVGGVLVARRYLPVQVKSDS